MTLQDVRFLSFDQYEAFTAAAKIRELQRDRDSLLSFNNAQSKDPQASLKRRESFIERIFYGEELDEEAIADDVLTDKYGDALNLGSDAALENLGIAKA